MGLTIHYKLHTRGTENHAARLVRRLHDAARQLNFKEVDPVVAFAGQECDFNKCRNDDPHRWTKIQARGSVERDLGGKRGSIHYNVPPQQIITFTAWPGEGSETLEIGLARYPAIIQTKDFGPLPTALGQGWHWRAFCKTQYASDPRCGGVPNFLRCHLAVIALLDAAKRLRCLKDVKDEGGCWANRDVAALAKQVGEWNELIAGLAGRLQDLAGKDGATLEAAITQFPNFEHLEAAGQQKPAAVLPNLKNKP